MGPLGCSETSVRNNHSSLNNSPVERSSQLLTPEIAERGLTLLKTADEYYMTLEINL